MYDEGYDNDFGMSDEELIYREMNPEDPWYMGPDEDDQDDSDEDYEDSDEEDYEYDNDNDDNW